MVCFKKTLFNLALASAAVLCLPAQAVTITYGGQAAADGSGLTSSFIPSSNTGLGAGWYVETFDPATASGMPGLTGSIGGISIGSGCSVNSYGTVGITTAGGGFGVQQGSNGAGAAPAGDTTCYGFGPQAGGTLPASVRIDYSALLNPGAKVSYLGLYYGSIDTYNDIAIYDGNTLLRTITGSEVLAAGGGTSGNQTAPGSNVYVNFAFDDSEAFTAFEFHTTGIAFEVDNIVVGTTDRVNNVPEPGSVALLSTALLGFVATRRRQPKI